MSAAPIFVGSVKTGQAALVNADGTALKTLFTAGANGARVDTISASSDDSSDRTVQLWKTVSGTDYLLGEVLVVDGAGSNGVDKAVNLLNATDLPWVRSEGGNPVMYLGANEVLKVAAKVAVTAAKTVYLVAQGGDY